MSDSLEPVIGQDFIGHLGHSLDLGSRTFAPEEGDLLGSTVEVRIGTIAGLKTLLTSTAPPANTVMSWTPSTGVLSIDLSESVINAVGVGTWLYEVTLVRASGRRLFAFSGTIQIVATIPTT